MNFASDDSGGCEATPEPQDDEVMVLFQKFSRYWTNVQLSTKAIVYTLP